MLNNQEKYCNFCNTTKNIDLFGVNKQKKDGLNIYCKVCSSLKVSEYSKTAFGVITSMYGHQVEHSKERGHSAPIYTKKEFKDWILSQDLFKELFKKWVESGYQKELKPSCDRHNDFSGYSFDNIELKTWAENKKKQNNDIKNGISTSGKAICKAVLRSDLDGNNDVEYHSMAEAARINNSNSNNIWLCCNGKRKTCNGFKWRYKNDS